MKSENKKIRVRIAPSPTGDPHVGLAYITLFNYAFAKKYGGELILRIEDTDRLRSKETSEEQIFSSLRWLGFNWSEGPDVGGPFGPYRQSERKEIYHEYVQKLLLAGQAYRCFCSAERLDHLRSEQRAQNLTTRYDGLCRHLKPDEVKGLLAKDFSYVIRLVTPTEGKTSFIDELRGTIEIDNDRLDDQVLIKSDGFPTYHFANVVDDHLMQITHVMRAEEWVSSTPKHVLLYQAFGWEMPKFIHMPLLRNADRSKISKRKNPVSLNYYRRKGILPEAMVNFLSLMGWSFGEDREFFTLDEMIERFSLKGIHLGGPVFDLAKLNWVNHHYLQRMTPESFAYHVRQEVFSDEFLKKLFPIISKRIQTFEEFVDKSALFFNGALDYSHDRDMLPKGKTVEEMKQRLEALLLDLDELYQWNATSIHHILEQDQKKSEWKAKDYFMTVRFALCGRKDSPPLAESMELIGREMVRFRLRDVLSHL